MGAECPHSLTICPHRLSKHPPPTQRLGLAKRKRKKKRDRDSRCMLIFSSSWESLGALLSVDCCLSVCLPVRPSACSSSRLSVQYTHGSSAWSFSSFTTLWFTWKVFFARHECVVFFSLQGFIFNYVFSISVLFTCILIYELCVHTAKQFLTINTLFKVYLWEDQYYCLKNVKIALCRAVVLNYVCLA